MALRGLRVGVGGLLVASGALMYAASWQRWADVCSWGDAEAGPCLGRQDHRFDFLPPGDPWEPVGATAQLAGGSLLVLALALVLLPTALTGRRPGAAAAVALAGGVLATVAVGVAAVRSGVSGRIVAPPGDEVAVYGCFLVVPVLLVRLAFAARGWALAAAVSLFCATPLVAAFSYAVGPYDSRPWWEAISGGFTVAAGLCLLAAAAMRGRSPTPTSGSDPPRPAVVSG